MSTKIATIDKSIDDVLSYAGLFSGAWGNTSEEINETIHNLHKEWEEKIVICSTLTRQLEVILINDII